MKRAVSAFAILTSLAVFSLPIFAQNEKEKVDETVEETITIEHRTQARRDEWSKEKSDLILRLRTARVNVQYLTERKVFEQRKADALAGSIAELERRLDESSRLQADLQDTLNVILGRLEDRVASDLPFLPEERRARLTKLRGEIVNPETIGAEKLRRLLEALVIETNYGNTVEVTQAEIDLEGEKLFVDVLRLGRISIFWRTTDGKRAGQYDIATGGWVELPGNYHRNIGEAMEMASRMRPIEVISLPLGRIQP